MVWLPGETRTWDEYKKKWIVVSDSNSKEKNNKEEDGKDRISELPDDMIIFILSLLPLREAGFTSVLSHRWSDLWKHTPNLNFAYYRNVVTMSISAIRDMTPENPFKRVNSVLKLHQALSLQKFEICVYVDKSVQRLVTKWLKFVWSRHVEILDLNFICSDPKYRVVLGASLEQTRPTKNLKTLSLENIKLGGEDISLFLRNCPLLSELNIKSSSVTSNLHVCGATLALKLLRIWECVYNKGSVVNISAPNLSQVDVDARIGKLLIENVPRLVVASFNIEGHKYTMHKFASAVPCFTSHLNTLILYLLYPKNILGKGFPQMPNLKELILIDESGLYEHDYLLPIPHVIAACPRLQSATFKFLRTSLDGRTEVELCPHQQLKTLKFQGSCASDIIQSVTYISDNFEAFQKINTCTHSMTSKADQVQIHKDHMRQLQVELSHQVQFKFFDFIKLEFARTKIRSILPALDIEETEACLLKW